MSKKPFRWGVKILSEDLWMFLAPVACSFQVNLRALETRRSCGAFYAPCTLCVNVLVQSQMAWASSNTRHGCLLVRARAVFCDGGNRAMDWCWTKPSCRMVGTRAWMDNAAWCDTNACHRCDCWSQALFMVTTRTSPLCLVGRIMLLRTAVRVFVSRAQCLPNPRTPAHDWHLKLVAVPWIQEESVEVDSGNMWTCLCLSGRHWAS